MTTSSKKTAVIKVSAPASTMLMGEHAVLFGHSAIVCAVAQRIFVELIPRDDTKVIISSALHSASLSLHDIMTEQITIDELRFVLTSIQLVKPTQGFELTITSEFSHTVGLGSSACVTAACVYALLLYKNHQGSGQVHNEQAHNEQVRFEQVFDIGLQVIHTVQKRGSGSDLVASVYGGLQSYQLGKDDKKITALLNSNTELPDLPYLQLYYCGYKTPTPSVLAQVAKQSEQFPTLYQELYQQMHSVSTHAKTAINAKDWQGLGKLMNIYHGLLDALGVCDGTLAELIYRARTRDNVLGAKISGSGLGDCIVTLATDNDNAIISGIEPIQVQISEQGLMIEVYE